MSAPFGIEYGPLRDFGEATAETAYALLQGVGEAEAARRLPVIRAALATVARTFATLEPGADADYFADVALRGFRTRAAELGFAGAREPTTLREAFHRGRLSEALKLLDTIPASRADRHYLARLRVDPATVAAKCGRLRVLPADNADSDGRGTPCVFAEVRDFDGETPIDFATWPLGRPEEFGTSFGVATLLGAVNVEKPSDLPLRVFRNPEDWLRSGCEGVVVSHPTAGRDLGRWTGLLAAQDEEHARELGRIAYPFFDPRKIVLRHAT